MLLGSLFLWSEVDGGAENDPLFPDDVRAEGQKYLVDNNIPHEIQVFPGVPHGQYLRYIQDLRLQLMLEQVLPLLENMRIRRSWMRKRLHLSRCSRGSNLIDDCHEFLGRFELCVTLRRCWGCRCLTRKQLFGLSLTHCLSVFRGSIVF